MKKSGKTLFVAVCVSFALIAASVTSFSQGGSDTSRTDAVTLAGTFQADSNCRSQLSSLEYRSEVNSAMSASRVALSATSAELAGMDLQADPADPGLSQAESAQLNGFKYMSFSGPPSYKNGKRIEAKSGSEPGFERVCRARTIATLQLIFAEQQGRLAVDGIELAQYMNRDKLNNSSMLQTLLQSERSRQFDTMAQFLNPATGTFYGSFLATDWRPCEISFSPASEAQFEQFAPQAAAVFRQLGENKPEAWVVTYFGEKKDTILAQELAYSIPEDSGYFKRAGVKPPPSPLDEMQPCKGSLPDHEH